MGQPSPATPRHDSGFDLARRQAAAPCGCCPTPTPPFDCRLIRCTPFPSPAAAEAIFLPFGLEAAPPPPPQPPSAEACHRKEAGSAVPCSSPTSHPHPVETFHGTAH
ncbi:hypothetical protein ABPG77_006394 [Micractinium sp. CCAP 211/92]